MNETFKLLNLNHNSNLLIPNEKKQNESLRLFKY